MENNILDTGLFNEGPSISFHERVEEILNNGFDFSISDCISEGFEIFKQNVGGFLGFTLLMVLISMIPEIVGMTISESLGNIFSVVVNLITIPLGVGFSIMAKRIYHNESYQFDTFFEGFQYTLPLIIASILVILATIFGFILFIIPGIYLMIAFGWVSPMIIFAKQESVEAMNISRKLISKNWFKLFAFNIVMVLLIFAGILALGVGLFVAVPVASCASYVAYEKVIGANLK